MTPTERARQIDKEEFAAECAAIRKRAYAQRERHRMRDPRVEQWIRRGSEPSPDRWIKITVESSQYRTSTHNTPMRSPDFRRPAVMHDAFGKAQSLDQWANEYGIAKGTIRTRLKLGWPLETALRKPPGEVGKRVHLHRPGVVSDFGPSEETGGWGPLQKTPNITFSGTDA